MKKEESKKCFVCEELGTSLQDKIEMLNGVDFNDEYFHIRCITLVAKHPERFDRPLCRRVEKVMQRADQLQKEKVQIIKSYPGFAKYYNLEK